MNHSLTVFLDTQNFLFLFFFGWKKNCNSKSSSNSNSGTRCPTRGFRIPDLSIKGSRKLIKWVSFFLFILMTYHSILSFLREMYVNNRLLFVGSLYTHKMTYIRFHTHPEYTIMTSWTNQLRCRQLKKKRCTGTSKSKMAANHMNYKIKLAAAGVSGELLDWFEFNNSNNKFMNLFKKAFQLNLQCQISKT